MPAYRIWSYAMENCEPCQVGNEAALNSLFMCRKEAGSCGTRPLSNGDARIFYGIFTKGNAAFLLRNRLAYDMISPKVFKETCFVLRAKRRRRHERHTVRGVRTAEGKQRTVHGIYRTLPKMASGYL